MALLEEARALGELLKQGWKPKRTIIYCVWDGEEPGLLGSTEWAETHAEELRSTPSPTSTAMATGAAILDIGGSHTLEKFINGVARDIEDPGNEDHRLEARAAGASPTQRGGRKEVAQPHRPPHRRPRLGLRLHRIPRPLGIASLNLGYGGEDGGGIYHSIYDDFYWYTHFSDTDFLYGRALSQTIGIAVMRLAGADLLPFDFTGLADTIHVRR